MKWLALGLAFVISGVDAFFLSIDAWSYVTGAVLITAIVGPAIRSRNKPKRNTRQPKIYGDSEFAGTKAMAEGGITTERR
jgi:hypothetical protein